MRIAVAFAVALIAAFSDRVLDTAHHVLNLSRDFFSLALALELFIAQYLSGHFFNLADFLFDGALDAIVVHAHLLTC